MRVLLLQLDGKFPNIALMKLSTHHKERGDSVRLKVVGNARAVDRVGIEDYDQVYASMIFKWSRPLAEQIQARHPHVVCGGSGWDVIPDSQNGLVSIGSRREHSVISKLADHGVTTQTMDYSIYPTFDYSIGFTQRGCRLGCGFCDVPVKEGKVADAESIQEIWRGGSRPKKLILWDNDTFGSPRWRQNFQDIRDGGFRVSFNQGVNARLMNEENAEGLANLPCYNAEFTRRCIYTAWDNRKDEEVLFRGLHWLIKYGVRPETIMVYMLIGYWPGETHADREYRRAKLRALGCMPYPMPYVRTRELVGFQRWVVPAYDKRVNWADWTAASYQPGNLGLL